MSLVTEKCSFVIGMSDANRQRGFTVVTRPEGCAVGKMLRQPMGEMVVALICHRTVPGAQRRQGEDTIARRTAGTQRAMLKHGLGAAGGPLIQRAHDKVDINIANHI